MFMLIGLGINAVVILMLFGIYSKLDELTRAINRLSRPDAALLKPSSEQAS